MIARGRVVAARGGVFEVELPGARIGGGVRFELPRPVTGTIRAIAGNRASVAIHGAAEGIAHGTVVRSDEAADVVALGACALGRALDAMGAPLDAGPALRGAWVTVSQGALLPAERGAVAQPLWTGIKAIDAMLTIGRGARVGFFGAPGAGKSTLLETIVGGVRADAVVVGLIGERGREAQSWIARRNSRTTIVCATSDRSASERVRAAGVALAQARALAARGLDVVLVLDSLARYAAALREVAVAAGESPGRGGYPPSVFAGMAQFVELCGCSASGSTTLLATVLNDGDDRDPVSEAARSLLDGHVQLSPHLANAGHFPAIDVLRSASRTMEAVTSSEHRRDAQAVRHALALLERSSDARSLGIEPRDAAIAAAVAAEEHVMRLLRQGQAPVPSARTLRMLGQAADILGEGYGYPD